MPGVVAPGSGPALMLGGTGGDQLEATPVGLVLLISPGSCFHITAANPHVAAVCRKRNNAADGLPVVPELKPIPLSAVPSTADLSVHYAVSDSKQAVQLFMPVTSGPCQYQSSGCLSGSCRYVPNPMLWIPVMSRRASAQMITAASYSSCDSVTE